MKLKPQNTYRHFLNFLGQPSRPVLQGIHFTENKMVATNSHILLEVSTNNPEGTDFILEPKSLRMIEGRYPDTDRVISTEWDSHFTLTREDAIDLVKKLKVFPKNENVKIAIEKNRIFINLGDSMISQPIQTQDNFEPFTVNITYLLSILKFIADCIEGEVTCGFNGRFRPLVFSQKGVFRAVLTPVRTAVGK